MILQFTVTVDVAEAYGKQYVPYIKHLLSANVGNAGVVTNVQFDEWMSDQQKNFEGVEKEADRHGELPL